MYLFGCKCGHCEYSCSGERGVVSLTSDITFAYLTYDDVRRISSLKEQTVIVIKAPEETKLEVPNPEEVRFFIFIYLFIYLFFLVTHIFLCMETLCVTI